MLSVFLVDDEYKAIVRLKHLLSSVRNAEVIGYAGSYEEAVTGICKQKPDLVFMDVEIRDRTGFEIVEDLHSKGIYPKIIFLTGHIQYAVKALRARAIDYLMKPIDLEELKQVLDRISGKNQQVLDDSICKIIGEIPLSERENQILALICKGMNSQQISKELYLSVHTIDTYRRKLLRRFNVSNTQELMSKLLQNFLHQA